jgi:hypothetical protein
MQRMRHLIFLVSASVLVVSCNHATPTTPHTTSDGPPMFDFILELPPHSTGTLHGIMVDGSTNGGIQSGLKVGLEAQTHTMEGTLYGSGGIYRFKLWSKEGSLVPGSFKALSGPVERLAPCEVVFVNRTAESGPFPISVQFSVQDSFDGDCHTNY